MSDPVAATKTKATGMFRFMSQEQLDNTAKVAALAEITFEAATALQLCRETIRDYCPPDEKAKVLGILLMVEGRDAS